MPPLSRTVAIAAIALLAARALAQDATPESLQARIDALKAPHVAWREIAWKSCLLDGLREAREKGKPVLLWVFIDRPADDARC